ncbi:sodium:solute symporter family transporter [Halorussus marinus]|uniref:sodium:solute symporter family transporter n=1 Tax=Halorussus marinus TaxID=2505976 RepID=UPI001B2FF1C3
MVAVFEHVLLGEHAAPRLAVDRKRPSGVVFTVILGGWAGIGASFGPLLIASLYWERLNKWGAYAGMIVGMSTVAF